MPDFDQFTAGIPPIAAQRPVYVKNPMDAQTRLGVAQNRFAAQNALVQALDRMEVMAQAARARSQTPGVISALSGLDPANDPDYDRKVTGIFAQAPDAITDPRVAGIMRLQGDIFRTADFDRRRAAERDDWSQKEMERNNLLLERQEQQMIQKSQLEQIEKLREQYEALPPKYRNEIPNLIRSGVPEADAISVATATWNRDKEMDDLLAQGFTEEEIEAAGVIGEDGTVNSRKKAALLGGRERSKLESANSEKSRSASLKELDEIEQRIMGVNDEEEPGVRDGLNARKRELMRELGWIRDGGGGTAPTTMKDTSAVIPSAKPRVPDTKEGDTIGSYLDKFHLDKAKSKK